MQKQYGFQHSAFSPLHTPMKAVGQTHSSWAQQNLFDGAMRPFGMNIQSRQTGSRLPMVQPGSNAAVVYHAGMRNAYNFLKNSRGADGDVMINDSQGNLNTVEKGLR